MENSKSSFWISLASIGISLITLFYAYIKPNWIDSAKLELTPAKQLLITHLFGDIQLNKQFSIVNTGKREALINKMECFLVSENNYQISSYDDVYYISDPDYITNDKKSKFQLLNGITVWSSNGYGNGLFYVHHHDQNYLSDFQEVKDTFYSKMDKYKISNRKSNWDDTWFDSYKLSDTIMNKIKELQSPIESVFSKGTYFLCDRLITSEGNKIYQVYTFQLTDKEVKTLKKLVSEIEKQRNILLSQSVTVDLKLASTEDKNKIIKKVDEFIARNN